MRALIGCTGHLQHLQQKRICERTHGIRSIKMNMLVVNLCIALWRVANSSSAVALPYIVVFTALLLIENKLDLTRPLPNPNTKI